MVLSALTMRGGNADLSNLLTDIDKLEQAMRTDSTEAARLLPNVPEKKDNQECVTYFELNFCKKRNGILRQPESGIVHFIAETAKFAKYF